MPDFDKLAAKAINDHWKGTRLARVLSIFRRFAQAVPSDLEAYVTATNDERETKE